MHEGVRYPCDQCEFTATRLGYLKKHKRSQHCSGISWATTTNTPESGTCDLMSEIEVEEDMILKTESSDISEFIEQCHEEDIFRDSGDLDYDVINTQPEEQIWNPDIKAEFFPHVQQ